MLHAPQIPRFRVERAAAGDPERPTKYGSVAIEYSLSAASDDPHAVSIVDSVNLSPEWKSGIYLSPQGGSSTITWMTNCIQGDSRKQ